MIERGVLGILNVTPDSFSDGGAFATLDAQVARAFAIAEEGAVALDIGGESTRPGATAVVVDEERRRVLPVLEALERRAFPLPVSIDTRRAAVARDALARGARFVNDVAALGDPGMAEAIAAARAGVILMHAQGTPETMQRDPRYEDVVREVATFLDERRARALAAGISSDAILVDPGIGFGKTSDHNWKLLRATDRLARIAPLVIGVSRKAFLGKLLGGRPTAERVHAGIGVALACWARGAHLIRAHDVRATVDALRAFDQANEDPKKMEPRRHRDW